MTMKTVLIVLLIASAVPEIEAQCSAIMVRLLGGVSCSASSTCSGQAPGYFCFQGACCGVQMNCNPGQIAALNDPAMTPVSCSNCPTGFTCVNDMCCAAEATSSGPSPSPSPSTSCPTGQVLVNGQCLSSVPIGSPCTADAQCQGGAFCTSGICTCPNGFTNVNNICSSPPTSCLTGQILVNGACLNTASINGPCTAQEQCPSGATCTNGVCTCPTGSTFVNNACTACPTSQVPVNGQCYSRAAYGTVCAYNEQCSFSNGQCLNGICSCLSGFSYNGNDCSNSCGVGSQQVMVNGVCYSVVGYQGTCQMSEQCNYGFGSCVNGICGCAPGYTYSGSYCTNGTSTTTSTTCATGQISVNNVCYNTAQLGQACVVSAQCIGMTNLACTNSICSVSCQTNQVLINNVCYSMVSAGQTCAYSQQCLGGTTCINSVCGTVTITTVAACASGQVQFNGQCASSIGNGCINYSCMRNPCSGVFPTCRYEQGAYYCCQNPAATNAGPVVGVTTPLPSATMPTCRSASATAELVGGAPKNCVSGAGQPCSAGYTCEWNPTYAGGRYICCGAGAASPAATTIGQMKMYQNTNQPLQCFTDSNCSSFPGFPNCVASTRFNNSKVCCSTTSC